MATFKHNGDLGDILASLPAIRHAGGGKLLIKLNHHGLRINEEDMIYIEPLIMNTGYVTEFRKLLPSDIIDYDFEKSYLYYQKPPFCNNIATYMMVTGQTDFLDNKELQKKIYLQPFLKVNQIKKISGKYIGVSRTNRHRDGSPNDHFFWKRMLEDGLDEIGLFFGLPNEHADFERTFNIKIEYVPVQNALETAEYIAGVECFVTSPTMNYWIAAGLQKTVILETRQTHWTEAYKWSKNECNIHRPHGFSMPFKNNIE